MAEERCPIAREKTEGAYYCTREAGHPGPCAAVPVDPEKGPEVYENVRCPELLGPLLNQRVLEITQHDEAHFKDTGESFIELHFENGYTLHLPIGDEGFDIQPPD